MDITKKHHTHHLNIKGRTINLGTKRNHITNVQYISVLITNQVTTRDHNTQDLDIQEEDMWEVGIVTTIEDTQEVIQPDQHTLHPDTLEPCMFDLFTNHQNILHQSINHRFTTQLFMIHPYTNLRFTRMRIMFHLYIVTVVIVHRWLSTATEER